MSLEKIKEIAEQMPESPERQRAMQAYSNLKTFEVIAESIVETPVEAAANINDFGRTSFVTHTTGLKERIDREDD